jgi:hypothetical protein
MARKEAAMIELTEAQRKMLSASPSGPIRVIDPATRAEFILIPATEYERLERADYDASPWTDDEMDLLAAEASEMLDSFASRPLSQEIP